MKTTILLSIAMAASAASEQSWLELSDGFVWEEQSDEISEFKPVDVSTRLLARNFRDALETIWRKDEVPPRIRFAEVDLNGDGVNEVFIENRELGGSGGTVFLIFSLQDAKYVQIGDLLGFGFEFLSPKNGWAKIKAYSRGGGGQHTRYLQEIENGAYVTVRIENHDLNSNKVTIRTE